MRFSVHSEIGPLRHVLVHRPGLEVDSMPPALMEELLFDDIVYGPEARREHDRFTAVMRCLGVHCHDLEDLLCAAIGTAHDGVAELLTQIQELEGVDPHTMRDLSALPPDRLAAALIQGVRVDRKGTSDDVPFLLAPVPNLLFSRDAQVVIGDHFMVSGMNRRVRRREACLSRFAFRHHEQFADNPLLIDFSERETDHGTVQCPHGTLEGGDVLIFNEGVVVVGLSERTMEPAVDRLVERLRRLKGLHHLIMVPIPRSRSAMHLDTIFTRTSVTECLVYAPMIMPGHLQTVSVVSIDLRKSSDWGHRMPSLLDALAELDVRLEPIACGGEVDPIQQAREQWTDGANSFAIRPGLILLYARNAATAMELERHGYQIVSVDEMEFSRQGECLFDFEPQRKYAVLVAGGELSRARGGPRCMTMPLVRDQLAS